MNAIFALLAIAGIGSADSNLNVDVLMERMSQESAAQEAELAATVQYGVVLGNLALAVGGGVLLGYCAVARRRKRRESVAWTGALLSVGCRDQVEPTTAPEPYVLSFRLAQDNQRIKTREILPVAAASSRQYRRAA